MNDINAFDETLSYRIPNPRGRGWRGLALLTLSVTLTLTGCEVLDNLVAVEAPSQIAADDLDNPANAHLLVASAVNAFECALPHYIAAGAYVGDELLASGNTGGSSYVFYGQRAFTPSGFFATYATGNCASSTPSVYQPLSTARWAADDILKRLDSWTDNEVNGKTELIAEAALYAGYSYTLIGEGMCSAAFDLGPEVMPEGIFQLAESRFTRAIETAEAMGLENFLNAALVGRARVRANMNAMDQAAADAARVPEGFNLSAEYSTIAASTENRIATLNRRNLLASVAPKYRTMEFDGIPDPRVSVTNAGINGPGGEIEIWYADKYPAIDAPVPVARWEEAQLILAEAALKAVPAKVDEAVAIINRLHDKVGLPHFNSTDPDEVMKQLIYERRAELFLEGQHLHDIRRFEIPLDPEPGTPYYWGGVYGDKTCFPIPEIEYLNNPNL